MRRACVSDVAMIGTSLDCPIFSYFKGNQLRIYNKEVVAQGLVKSSSAYSTCPKPCNRIKEAPDGCAAGGGGG